MKKYVYEALDSDGNQSDGILTSDTFEEVVAKILSSGLYPTRIEELSGAAYVAHSRLSKFKKIRDKLEHRSERINKSSTAISPASDRIAYSKIILLALFVAFWLAMVAVYSSCSR